MRGLPRSWQNVTPGRSHDRARTSPPGRRSARWRCAMNAKPYRRLDVQTPAAPELAAYTLDTIPDHAPAQFVVESILPRRHVTLLSGHGGSGKSTLALTLAAHVACGVDWAGLHVEPGHVVFLSLEDEVKMCASLLRRIASSYGLNRERIAQNLTLLDGVSSDAALAVERSEHGNTDLRPTAAMGELADAARGCSLIVVDNASDALLGDANSQATVRVFMRRMLGRLARENDCALLLLAHIDKTAARGKGAQQNFIGSVSWHNSARSRLALTHAEPAGLVLDHEKSNLCKRIPAIRLAFNAQGVPMPLRAPTAAEEADTTAQHAEAILEVIRAATAQGHVVTDSRHGPATTQKQLEAMPSFPHALRGPAAKFLFFAAIDSLQTQHKLRAVTFLDARRKKKVRLEVPEQGFAQVRKCANPPDPPVPERGTCAPARQSAPMDASEALEQTGALEQTPPPEVAV